MGSYFNEAQTANREAFKKGAESVRKPGKGLAEYRAGGFAECPESAYEAGV